MRAIHRFRHRSETNPVDSQLLVLHVVCHGVFDT
jgi:hypothetical protein